MLRSSEPNREREAATCGEPMVRKEMFEANSIPAEKLAASKTILKIMLQDLNQMCEESEKAVESGVGVPSDGQFHLRSLRQPKSTRTFVCLASNSLNECASSAWGIWCEETQLMRRSTEVGIATAP
ncbi:hypothetical protein T4D_180 [Trichinella pseudospiralis]|uniref:Uncharacterized protein n=1 Tax=Trichinella pseudospiralis TaxID=6337 RepID=A0A0V1FZ95_TRIPS|nr:hypothetical protein T4D_180 [Trichinella pseudospiralis]